VSAQPRDAGSTGTTWTRARIVRSAVLLTITGVSLYLLAPSLIEVFSSAPQLKKIEPWWIAGMIALETGSYVCMVHLQRLALQARGKAFALWNSYLAGNAVGRVIPGGGAAAGALQYRMLVQAGLPGAQVATGLTVSALLTFAVLLALPVAAVPAIVIGAPAPKGLERAAYLGAGIFVLLFVAGLVLFVTDRPLRWVGRTVERLHNRLLRRRPPISGLSDRLIEQRDLIARVIGRRWWEALLFTVGKWGLDYATLVAALAAVGAYPRPSLVLLAYCASQLLAQIPITPGGLGFVEAGLTGTLALAGVSAGDAVLATLAYRLVSYWLPLPAGLVGYVAFRRRYGPGTVATDPAGGG
jgi:uncharacterized protein (TIRG00374 family)